MAAVLGNNPFRINEWRVDPDLNRLSRGELTIKVDPQNMKVLELLASRPGEVFSSTQIEEIAWPDVVVSPNSVYQSIAHLRRALGDDKKVPRFIETISKKGYRCVGRVEPIAGPGPAQAQTVSLNQAPAPSEPKALPQVKWLKTVMSVLALVLVVGTGVVLLLSSFEPAKRDDESFVAGLPVGDGPANITAETLLNAGDLALIAGRFHEAAQHFDRALALARKGGSDSLVAEALAKLADAYLWQGKYQQAANLGAQSVRILESSAQPMDPTQINPRIVLGEALIHLDRFSEAETHLVRAIDLSELLYGSSSPRTEGARSTLIKLRVAEGRLSEAEQLTRDLLAGPAQKGYHRMNHVLHQSLLGNIMYDQQRYAEVIDLAQEALREVEALATVDHPYASSMHQLLANAYLRTNQLHSAETHARASFRIWKLNQSDQQRLARAASTLGEVFVHQGKLNEAREQLTYAARILQEGAGHWHRSAKRENDERIALLNAALAKNKS